jgi:hypothetical protein
MAAAYVGIMIFPPLYGVLAQTVTPDIFPLYLAVFYALMLGAALILKRELRNETR